MDDGRGRTMIADGAPTGFWGMLGHRERDALLDVAYMTTYRPGTRIFREGEPSSFALVIQNGWVKVAGGTSKDTETALALRRTGDLVGESASADRPRSATVVTLDEVRALTIPACHFSALVNAFPGIDQALQRTYRDRRIESDQKRMDVRKVNSDKRLARQFLELAECARETDEHGIVLDIPLSQDDFGQLICASTGTVERTLSNWRKRGIVATSYRKHVLLDLPALCRIAGRTLPGTASSPHGG